VKELLPTPAKAHYIYNLRDISNVFLGISRATSTSISNKLQFLKLWAHECMRVFSDRMINNQDIAVFENLMKSIVEKEFDVSWKDIIKMKNKE
jgi:dynein heavy chain